MLRSGYSEEGVEGRRQGDCRTEEERGMVTGYDEEGG